MQVLGFREKVLDTTLSARIVEQASGFDHNHDLKMEQKL